MDVSDNNADIERKQNYLKEQIVDKGYDQQKFLDYCMEKNANADDLGAWNFDDLKKIVEEFQNANTNLKIEDEIKKQEEKKDFNADIENIKMSQSNERHEVRRKTYTKVPCRVLEKSPLNDKQIKVLITNPKPIETGFLSSNYVIYQIITQELNWTVTRRYSDFEWLRHCLVKFNPGKVVPPLPKKKIGTRRFEADFIEKRMAYLQKFIDNCLRIEEFKACEPFTAFLSLQDRNMFESKMKELSSYRPSLYVEEFRTFCGTVNIANEEEDNEKYFTNIINYFRIQDQLFERLNMNMKRFYVSMNDAGEALASAQKDFETFQKLNTKVLMKEQITQSYENIGVFIKNWRRILLNQNEMIKTHFKSFFKFVKMEATSYEELITNREALKATYLAEKNKLIAKKEKLWQVKDTTKWEIVDEFNKVDQSKLLVDKDYAFTVMCTSETRKLESMRKQFGYVNRMNFEELKNMINNNCKRFLGNIKEFCDVFYPSLTDGLNVYTRIQMFALSYPELIS